MMIEFYYWPAPNGHKVTMFREEAELDYTIHPVDISAGDHNSRHGVLPVDRVVAAPAPEPRGVSELEAVVPIGSGKAGDRPCLRERRALFEPARGNRSRQKDFVRPDCGPAPAT